MDFERPDEVSFEVLWESIALSDFNYRQNWDGESENFHLWKKGIRHRYDDRHDVESCPGSGIWQLKSWIVNFSVLYDYLQHKVHLL